MKSFCRAGAGRGLAAVEVLPGMGLAGLLAMLGTSQLDVARQGARVAEAEASLDRLAAAMEAYMIDNRTYLPSDADSSLPGHGTASGADTRLLTTPIAYVDQVPVDPFRRTFVPRFSVYALGLSSTGSFSYNIYPHRLWMSFSWGPDQCTQSGGYRSLATVVANESLTQPLLGGQTPVEFGGGGNQYNGMRYDPTNGLVSVGDIYRFSRTN